jgi:hypothetical protein
MICYADIDEAIENMNRKARFSGDGWISGFLDTNAKGDRNF